MVKTTSKKSFQWIPLLVGFPLLILSVITIYLVFPKQKAVTNSREQEIITQEERTKFADKKSLEYFISDILIQYPKLSSEISASDITRVFPFALKQKELEDPRGWVVEVDSAGKKIYYLVSALSQTQFKYPMTGATGEEAECTLSDVKFVGNEAGLVRDLDDKNGYIVLSGQNCRGYGRGGFVSVYKMTDGKKIALQGDFALPGRTTNYKGVSQVGNAQGRLRGVYGVNNPTLAVEYGGFEDAGSKLQEVTLIGYFDLQTGSLNELVKFE